MADNLSRPPAPPEGNPIPVNLVSLDLPQVGAEQLRAEQLSDPELQKIIVALEFN